MLQLRNHNDIMYSHIVDFRYPTHWKFHDLSNLDFGDLHVEKYLGKDNRHKTYYICTCKCGNTTIVRSDTLLSGEATSCGCKVGILASKRIIKIATKHNLSNHRIYKIYHKIRDRCLNSNNKHFDDYGGRGITLAKIWRDSDNGFLNFYNWSLNNGYSKELSIDRIDNDDNYSPDNCRWTVNRVQANNKRKNIYINIESWVFTPAIWGEIMSISSRTIINRINYGWNIDDIITVPVLHNGINYDPNTVPHQIIYVEPELFIYNKYDEFIKKGLILPFDDLAHKSSIIRIN